MRIHELLRSATERLREAGIENGEMEAYLLLGHILNLSRTKLLLSGNQPLAPEHVEYFEAMLRRRLMREPLAYILGEQEFWSLPFYVNNDVLIPRPETEFFVEQVIATVRADSLPVKRILDLGTGSGVIAIVLARELEPATVVAVDRSRQALRLTLQNISRHEARKRIHLLLADWTNAFKPLPFFDLIVSNPPYISRDALPALQPEVFLFEPQGALDGGPNGLDAIQFLAHEAWPILRPGGWIFLEIGSAQGRKAKSLFTAAGAYDTISVLKDYAGHDRVLRAKRIIEAGAS